MPRDELRNHPGNPNDYDVIGPDGKLIGQDHKARRCGTLALDAEGSRADTVASRRIQ